MQYCTQFNNNVCFISFIMTFYIYVLPAGLTAKWYTLHRLFFWILNFILPFNWKQLKYGYKSILSTTKRFSISPSDVVHAVAFWHKCNLNTSSFCHVASVTFRCSYASCSSNTKSLSSSDFHIIKTHFLFHCTSDTSANVWERLEPTFCWILLNDNPKDGHGFVMLFTCKWCAGIISQLLLSFLCSCSVFGAITLKLISGVSLSLCDLLCWSCSCFLTLITWTQWTSWSCVLKATLTRF